MQFTIRTAQILKVLYIISWILFIGISIEAGGFILNAVFAIAKPDIVSRLWHEVDLMQLMEYDHGYFFVIMLMISIVHILKAVMFYLIIKILHSKRLNIEQPFNKTLQAFIVSLAYLSFLIGLFSSWGVRYTEWLRTKSVMIPDAETIKLGGADVWLFMGIILFVIAQVFKRGVEIQSEHELTI